MNLPTLRRFLNRKKSNDREALIADMCRFLKRPTFNLVIHRPAGMSATQALDLNECEEAHECEVLCRTQTIPPSLEGTVSIQILQTPPLRNPVGYFISPAPRDMVIMQREINRIDNAWASALDQYREALGGHTSPLSQLSDPLIREHTAALLQAI